MRDSRRENDLARLGWCDGNEPLGQVLQAHHSLFQALHLALAPAYALVVNLLHLIYMRMFPRIGHVAGEPYYRRLAVQQLPVPVDLQHAPAALDRVVLAVIRRAIKPPEPPLWSLPAHD